MNDPILKILQFAVLTFCVFIYDKPYVVSESTGTLIQGCAAHYFMFRLQASGGQFRLNYHLPVPCFTICGRFSFSTFSPKGKEKMNISKPNRMMKLQPR